MIYFSLLFLYKLLERAPMAQSQQQQQTIFQRIIFEQCDQNAELRKLTKDQKQKLKDAVAQKIAYEAVYRPSYPQEEYKQPQHTYHPPSIMATLCCFLYPQDNREAFSVTSALFCKKLCRVFLFWRDDFLKIKQTEEQEAANDGESHPDQYGPLWLTITYIILLGLTSNLNNYFVESTNFDFNSDYVVKALGFCIIFLLAQTLIYPAAVGCLDGQMSNPQSTNLVGYSLALYFIPTFFCIIPSQAWHTIMLLIAAGLRFIFLGRNFCSRVDSKEILLYSVILAIQGLHFYLIISTFYSKNAGTSVDQGMQKVFHTRAYSQ